MSKSLAFASCLIFLCVAGCSGPQTAAAPTAGTPSVDQAPVDSSKVPMKDSGQSMVADSTATGLGKAPVSDADLAKYKKTYDAAKKTYEAKKTDTKAADAFLIASVWYGSGTMYAANLDPKPKYRGALTLYGEALTVNPTSDEAKKFAAEALDNKQLIESIYKSMGKPVPQ